MSDEPANPFSRRGVLALVLFGGAVFVALLWMIGAGLTSGSTNDGGSHAGGNGLNGYSALADYLERRGYAVRRTRSKAMLDDRGLLVLTPPLEADGSELQQLVERRRSTGPTLVITPKWIAFPVAASAPGAKPGWVTLAGTQTPRWQGFLDNVSAGLAPMTASGGAARWRSSGGEGRLPVAESVQSGRGQTLVPLVGGVGDGRVLAGYFNDGGTYPKLADMALEPPGAYRDGADYGGGESLYPLVVVFEPDLLDNYGMRELANARLAERLVFAAAERSGKPVNFDLTLNGYARSANLLTLAFTPPFLAATLCLLIAALAVAWRAFLRFGPPRRTVRAIAFGKRALVANTAGLIRRTRRLHLVAAPYAEHVRERLGRALALPRLADSAATEAAIDRALAARRDEAPPFSVIAARLRAARRPLDILKAAQDLHSLERMLKR